MNSRTYIICYDFRNTSGNHAGMLHLYKSIAKNSDKYVLYTINRYKGKGCGLINKIHIYFLTLYLLFKCKKNDKILLTEYLFPQVKQQIMAKMFHLLRPNIKVFGMAHLVPSLLLEKNSTENNIIRQCNYVDKIITLGHSLTDYLNSIAVNNVVTTFHYVDNTYYLPANKKIYSEQISVIVVGNLARNFELISRLICKLENVHFYVCQGVRNLSCLFEDCHNVTLLGFLNESELKQYMDNADISLNVMEDTVGSNVITTSMAMGLAMVVSDVGSIRDYCSENNAIFCKSEADFCNAINMLDADRLLLRKMKEESLNASKSFGIDLYLKDIETKLEL